MFQSNRFAVQKVLSTIQLASLLSLSQAQCDIESTVLLEFSDLSNRHPHPTHAWEPKCLKEYVSPIVEGGGIPKFQSVNVKCLCFDSGMTFATFSPLLHFWRNVL